MKKISILDNGDVKTVDVIRAVCENPKPGKGIDVAEMRRRIRILDALDKASSDKVELEDADHAFLSHLTQEFPFAVAKRELLDVIDRIVSGGD